LFWQTEPWLDSEQFVERVFFGASVLDLVTLGEIYRLVTANFLHTGWPHLVNNLLGLLFFGWLVEAAIGAKRTALLLFAAGTAGYALTVPLYGFVEEYSFVHATGSSAAVWGLQGACALITTRRRRDLPVGFRVPIVVWGLIGIQLLFQSMFEGMSIVIHLFGGAVGLLGLAYLTRNNRALPLPDSSRLTPSVVTLALVVLVSFGFAIRNDRIYGMQPYFERIHKRLASSSTSDSMRNDCSFLFAIASKAPEQSMQLALEIMKGVVERDPDPAYRDTLATLYYRTGELDPAIEIARSVRWEEPTTWFDTQLARFYAAALYRSPKAKGGLNPQIPGPNRFARIEVLRSGSSGDVEFAVTLTPLEPRPAQIHALVYRGDELHSFLELDVEWILQHGRCELSTGAISGLDAGSLTARAVWYGAPDPGAVSITRTCRLTTLVSDVRRLP
jgi:membrane associated rhomboid family serine protease